MGIFTIFVLLALFAVVLGSNREAYRVVGLGQYGALDEMYAGLMSLDRQSVGDGAFFFWLAKKRNNNIQEAKKRLVIWLNGGPGCSSMVGMMWENGPFNINFGENGRKYDLKMNPYSWNEVADVIFVEQPIRVGFSAAAEGAPKIRNEDQVGEDFRNFLVSFLVDFPEYKEAEIFLSGESYAGFYIPWIAEHIISKQLVPYHDDATGETYHERDVSVDNINLVGAAIGNGVLDFLFQEPSYAEYAYYHGLIPLAAKERFDQEWVQCLQSLEREGKPLTRISFNKCNMMGKVLEAAGQPNEYDTSTFLAYDRIIKAGGPFDTFFSDPDIQRALHVRGYGLPGVNFMPENYDLVVNRSSSLISTMDPTNGGFYYEPPSGWRVCYDEMDDDMKHDHPVSAVPVLQFLVNFQERFDTDVDRTGSKSLRNRLSTISEMSAPISSLSSRQLLTKHRIRGENRHLRVMLYSGEFDLNCNTLGTLHTLEHNWWRHRPWEDAERALWKLESGEVGGEYFHFDDIFSFLIVRNSGHLLPMDKPAVALSMLTRFLNNQTFADLSLPKESFYRRPLPPMKSSSVLSLNESSSMTLFLMGFGWLGLFVGIGCLYYMHVVRQKQESGPHLATNSKDSSYRSRSRRSSGILEMTPSSLSPAATSSASKSARGSYQTIQDNNDQSDNEDDTTEILLNAATLQSSNICDEYGSSSQTASKSTRPKKSKVSSKVAERIHQWERLSSPHSPHSNQTSQKPM